MQLAPGDGGGHRFEPHLLPAQRAATAEARTALEELLRLDLSVVESPDLHRAALEIATELRQAAAYDSHYIALALERGCPLWTADSKLHAAAKEVLSEINVVG